MHWVTSGPGNVYTRDVFTKIISTGGAWGGDYELKLRQVIGKKSFEQQQGGDDVWYLSVTKVI